ncbi:hypothetical protein CYFUS_004905 [Cystobacter fuscus]|uniref:Uncharacterized protein n=1 Tax=Cystobacter fuscus TaxID=43 RepID=A0A250J7R5_9BACT|nr:hypothetical protein CYFUS_004905 [Cystobacter fuscus]
MRTSLRLPAPSICSTVFSARCSRARRFSFTEVSGVLSSCEAMDRNSSRAATAALSSRSSRSFSSSAFRFSVTSRVTLAKPRGRPSSSRSAVVTTCAQKRLPSLRTRSHSDSYRP